MTRIIVVLAVVCAAGCERNEVKESETRSSDTTSPSTVAADNTKKNERDRGPTLTAGDQAENETDRTITQRIRQGVMKDDNTTMSGKNVKIITVNGVVTLRGPVESAQEKATIATIAQGVAGVTRVDNQLEIAAK